jgi:hypothetical protein
MAMENCLIAWRGAYQGKEKVPTVALEAIFDHHLWFWHLFFGMPGANNNLNILDFLPIYKQHLEGMTPKVTFQINNKKYDMAYYLTVDWALFMKTISEPLDIKQNHFLEQQEADVKILSIVLVFYRFVSCFLFLFLLLNLIIYSFDLFLTSLNIRCNGEFKLFHATCGVLIQ